MARVGIPGDLTTITVTGTYTDPAGNALAGSVQFAAPVEVCDSTGHVVVSTVPVTVSLVAGAFSVVLPCSDNADLAPTSFAYNYTENLTALGYARTIPIALPHTLGSSIDISQLIPAATTPVINPNTYGVLGQPNSWAAANTFNGQIIANGSSPALQIVTGATSGDLLTSDASGNATWQPPPLATPTQFPTSIGAFNAVGSGTTGSRSDHTHSGLGLSGGTVTGPVTLSGSGSNLTVGGTLGVTGASTLTGALAANGGLTGTTGSFSSTLGVTGTTTLTGALTANGGMTATTGSYSSTLGVTGAATLSSTLGVTGAATLSGGATVTGAETVSTNLTVGAASVINGGGTGVLGIADAATAPTSNPTGGTILFSASGTSTPLRARDPGGNIRGVMPAYATKTSDQSIASSTSQTADTALLVALEANATYLVTALIVWTSASTTPGITNGWTVPASTTIVWGDQAQFAANSTASTESWTLSVASALKSFQLFGYVVVGGTTGNLQFTWAQTISNATATTVKAGSWLRVERVK